MTIQEAFDNFIFQKELADLSPKTISAYTQFITPFMAYISPLKPVDDLRYEDVQLYISQLLKKPLAKPTKATHIRHLKIFLRWLEKECGLSVSAVKIKVPKSPRREVHIYSPEEVAMIFDAVQTESDWLTLRNKCMIALMYDSGLRQSELCSIECKGISFSDNHMIVRGKGCKERVVPLGKLTQQLLSAYLAACPFTSPVLFVTRRGLPLSSNSVKLFVSRLARKLPFDLSCHKLRHNFATNYCIDQYEHNGQIDIYKLMYLMGHEDIETTRIYLHFAYEQIAAKGNLSHLDMLQVM